jgi:hypothetical protein
LYLDSGGNLWVADYSDNRVLRFPNAVTASDGAAANLVLGQPDFITDNYGNDGVNSRGLFGPVGVTGGLDGSIFVADFGHYRVLRFGGPTRGNTKPQIKVSGPHNLRSSRSKIVLRGTARSLSGTLNRVELKLNGGVYRRAAGTGKWKFTVALKSGRNVILARAVDIGGTVSPVVKITVRYER